MAVRGKVANEVHLCSIRGTTCLISVPHSKWVTTRSVGGDTNTLNLSRGWVTASWSGGNTFTWNLFWLWHNTRISHSKWVSSSLKDIRVCACLWFFHFCILKSTKFYENRIVNYWITILVISFLSCFMQSSLKDYFFVLMRLGYSH